MASLAQNEVVLDLCCDMVIFVTLALGCHSTGFVLPLKRSCGFLDVWQPLESQSVVVDVCFPRAAPHSISKRDSNKCKLQHSQWPMRGK